MNSRLEKLRTDIQFLIQKDGKNPVLSLELLKKIQFERVNFSYAKIARFIGLDAGKVRSQIRKLQRKTRKSSESSALPRIVELAKSISTPTPTLNTASAKSIPTSPRFSTENANIKPLLELSLANGTVIKVFS